MSTWGSKNDLSKSQFYLNRMKAYVRTLDQAVPGPELGIEILEEGKLKSVVKEIIQIARVHRMFISIGHLSIQESLVLVEEYTKQGVPFALPHPFSRSVGASINDQKEGAGPKGEDI